MTWDRRELNPWLGLVLVAVSDQFGVPFPPPSVRGPFSLENVGAHDGDELFDARSAGVGAGGIGLCRMAVDPR
jgi:hypothetical protein